MKDMPRWFTLQEVTRMEGMPSYHVGSEGFQKIPAGKPGGVQDRNMTVL